MDINTEINFTINELKNDRTHGASELARQAVGILKAVAEQSTAKSVADFLVEQRAVGEILMQARPAMAPVHNIVGRLLDMLSGKPEEAGVESIRRFTVFKADELIAGSIQAVSQIARHALRVISSGDILMTHSYSSTVIALLKEASARYRSIEVITTGEEVAERLTSQNIPVTFIDDAAVGLYITTTTKIIVGADRICADGSLINGVGTYPVAVMAKRAGIPFYVFCETLKFDSRLKGEQIDLEEKETFEIARQKSLPEKVRVRNPAFDITPLELITGVVTENGLFKPREVTGYLKKLLA